MQGQRIDVPTPYCKEESKDFEFMNTHERRVKIRCQGQKKKLEARKPSKHANTGCTQAKQRQGGDCNGRRERQSVLWRGREKPVTTDRRRGVKSEQETYHLFSLKYRELRRRHDHAVNTSATRWKYRQGTIL